jgi:deoxyribose-phosphate aldolase
MRTFRELMQEIPYEEALSAAPEAEPVAVTPAEIMRLIDLTTLDVKDTEERVAGMCRKVNTLPERFPGMEGVAGVCVYPVFIPVVRETLTAEGAEIVSVSAGFPAAQTFMEVKVRETEKAVEEGATEIDIVIAVGKILEGREEEAYDEVRILREVTGGRARLKVILEAGVLDDPHLVHRAAVAAMAAGADFIKTSTGKVTPAARLQDVQVMARAARRYHEVTGRRVGIKPAGGISTEKDALLFMGVVEKELGKAWLNPRLFRIGASRLANDLLDTKTSYF